MKLTVIAATGGIVSAGTAHIIAAMQAAGTRRIIAVAGIGLSTVPTPNRPRRRREPGAGTLMTLVTLPLVRATLGPHERCGRHGGAAR